MVQRRCSQISKAGTKMSLLADTSPPLPPPQLPPAHTVIWPAREPCSPSSNLRVAARPTVCVFVAKNT